MTHVDVVYHAGQIQSIKVEGHAGQDEYGYPSLKNIMCLVYQTLSDSSLPNCKQKPEPTMRFWFKNFN